MENEKVFISVTPIENDRDSLKVVENSDGTYTLSVYDKNGTVKYRIESTLRRIIELVVCITDSWNKDEDNKEKE